MKNFIFSIFSFFSLTVSAQTSIYHPLPDSSATWCETHWGEIGMCGTQISYLNWSLGNDTIINGTHYTTILLSYNSHGCAGFKSGYKILQGGIRQDLNKKEVFFAASYAGWREGLLYNFNLNNGDSVAVIGPPVQDTIVGHVASIDSILIGNEFRKRFNFIEGNSWIEGIGSIGGLLTNNFIPSGKFQGDTLNSATVGGNTIYQNSQSPCKLVINSVSNVHNGSNPIVISPNPAKNVIYLSGDYLKQVKQLRIVNALNEVVYSKSFDTGNLNEEIDISKLSDGIYFVILSTLNQNFVVEFFKN